MAVRPTADIQCWRRKGGYAVVLGYDSALAVKPPKKFKFAGWRLPYDHCHRTASDQGVPHAVESAPRLLEDFFAEVDRVIKEARQ